MAKLFVTEYAELASQGGQTAAVAAEPALVEQVVTYTGTAASSSAFDGRTKYVRIHTDGICSILFGTGPTATLSTRRLAANQTEYFAVPRGQSYKVSAIVNT